MKLNDLLLYGVYKPKQKIESVRELASNLGINPNTVKKAYDELERRGVITTISTKGTFIADDTKSLTKLKIEEKVDIIRNEILELQKLRNFKRRNYKKTFVMAMPHRHNLKQIKL